MINHKYILSNEEKAQKQRLKEAELVRLNSIKASQEEEGSLKQLRLTLSNLNRKYDSLSKAMRESTEGRTLQESIVKISSTLNKEEQATGRYQRNEGNYPDRHYLLKQARLIIFGFIMKVIGIIWIATGWTFTIGLLVAKLTGDANFSWWWVLFPIGTYYVPAIVAVTINHIIFMKRIWNKK